MRIDLQRRLMILVGLTLLLMLGVLGVFGLLSVKGRVDEIMQQQLNLAEATANHLEYILQENVQNLNDLSLTLGSSSNDSGKRSAIHEFYVRSIFNDGIWLLDDKGRLILSEPDRPNLPVDMSRYAHIRDAIQSRRPVISNYYKLEPTGEPLVSIAIPRIEEGKLAGLTVGNISLSSSALRRAIELLDLGDAGYIELVDVNGIVIASTRNETALVESQQSNELAGLINLQRTRQWLVTDRDTRQGQILAFFPLSRLNALTTWGIAIRQWEHEALVPANMLQRQFMAAGFVLLLFGMLFAWGVARSIVHPISALTKATRRIASGNLADPVPILGSDEVRTLAESFDTMRERLKASLERIQEWNKELEVTVQERTRELEKSQAARGELLRKIITAQEEERKRIARELHDETSQALVTLVVTLDTTLAASRSEEDIRKRLSSMKDLAVRSLDGVRKMIFDLRPSVLDDLGLLPALRWYADERLKPSGVRVRFEVSGTEKRLPSEVETALFRVVQEALTNVSKHAEAENVVISAEFTDTTVAIEVEDDGKGFDLKAINHTPDKGSGLGLLGMRERISLLEGNLTVDSEPGGGTRVRLEMPLLARGPAR